MKRALSAALAAILLAMACYAFVGCGADAENQTLENDRVSITFSGETGAILSLKDKAKGVEFLADAEGGVPFRLEVREEMVEGFSKFSYERDDSFSAGTRYELTWETEDGFTVRASISLEADADEVVFYSSVENGAEKPVQTIEYPIIPNIKTISPKGEDDYLAHSYATGYLIHNPMENFSMLNGGFRFLPYPEGFTGATMQFFTYYCKGGAGLYFATRDSGYNSKWYNFYKNNGYLEASFMHGYNDVGADKGIEVNYPTVVKLLGEGSWYEAADIYKGWAIDQEWAARGPLYDAAENEKASWLLEDVGLVTFGINASKDRTLWIDRYHQDIDTTMFHVLGPDWSAMQNYMGGMPGGFDDWFPAQFNENNLSAIEGYGDYFAPFEFDYILNTSGSDFYKIRKAQQSIPTDPKSYDSYNYPFICPATEYMSDLHVRRDETLASQYPIDSMYYDITAANIFKACLDDSHGHPVGAGAVISEAFVENYRMTNAAMAAKRGTYIPAGTEVFNETLLGVVDYYQARANGAPATEYEGLVLRPLVAMGEAEVIPLLTYVYHEYGALRMDGWGKLTEEAGSLFYETVSKTYLWGGIYEINHEYSSMESIDGVTNPSSEHYWYFDDVNYAYSRERAQYLNQFARFRTELATKYWAYGTMRPAVELDVPFETLDYYSYNVPQQAETYHKRGDVLVRSVLNSVYDFRDESRAYFFSNVSGETAEFSFTAQAPSAKDSYTIVLTDSAGQKKQLGTLAGGEMKELTLSLGGLRICMVELV